MPAKHTRSVVVVLGGIAAGLAIIGLQQAYGMSTVAANWHASGPATLLLAPLAAACAAPSRPAPSRASTWSIAAWGARSVRASPEATG